MASEAQIHRVRKDKEAWRLLVKQLLRYGEALQAKDLAYLESLESRHWLERLTYEQMVWVFDIRDRMQTVSQYRGYSTAKLIRICYENHPDLGGDDEDEAWVVELYRSGRTALRNYEAARLHAWAKGLGEVDNWAA